MSLYCACGNVQGLGYLAILEAGLIAHTEYFLTFIRQRVNSSIYLSYQFIVFHLPDDLRTFHIVLALLIQHLNLLHITHGHFAMFQYIDAPCINGAIEKGLHLFTKIQPITALPQINEDILNHILSITLAQDTAGVGKERSIIFFEELAIDCLQMLFHQRLLRMENLNNISSITIKRCCKGRHNFRNDKQKGRKNLSV